MSTFTDPDPVLATFSGVAPLFPLSGVVLFPQALLPLNIFEPRYRAMTADALKGERLIAMALPEESGGNPPPIHPIVGLGKIISEERQPDGRYHLVLRGIARARVIEEASTSQLPYRVARLEILKDEVPAGTVQAALSRRLIERFEEAFPAVRQHPMWTTVSHGSLPLGAICDLIAAALPLAPELAQRMLADTKVQSRSRALFAVFDELAAKSAAAERADRIFPPEFSVN